MQASASLRASSAAWDARSQKRTTATRDVTTARSVIGLISAGKLTGMASRSRLGRVLPADPGHDGAGNHDAIGDKADHGIDLLGRQHKAERARHAGQPGHKGA